MSSIQQYLDLFASQRTLLDEGCGLDPLNARRDEAARMLDATGLPGRRTERYKYTDVEAALAPDYGLNLRRLAPGADPYARYRCNVPDLHTRLRYVVGDVVTPERTDGNDGGEGVQVLTFAEAERTMPGWLDRYYHRAAARTPDGLTALNTLLAQDGLVVRIAAGTQAATPVQIVNMADGTAPLMSNRRVVVVAERGAAGAVLFCDHARSGQPMLTTQVVEAYVEEGASLDLYSVEETHTANTRFSHLYVEQQAASRTALGTITLTNGLTCNRTDVRLLGQGATTSAYGAAIADGHQHVDNNLLVDHAAPGCTSDLLFKYVLDGAAVGAYAGKVLVREGAQQSFSEQTNANLCASDEARAFAQPMLEIYADDVKCNHGSTVGKLDESALFYMRQRGIEEHEARLLLQHAFVNDVLRRVGIGSLRERLSYLVEMRFRGRLTKCNGCSLCK